ncbi:MAG: hypothetical protein GY822_20215 [Deltaproteobacteria bacterium]|nr:hypothetical protein [Deltaproteobacteria bacterium]
MSAQPITNALQPSDVQRLIDLQKELPASWSRRMPKMGMRQLNRLFHVDELNAFWQMHPEKEGLHFIDALLKHLDLRIEVHGALPDLHRKLVVCNHPSGIVDGLVLLHLLGTQGSVPQALANAALQKISPLKKLMLAIDKPNGSTAQRLTRDAAKNIDAALKGDAPLLIFPSGQVAKLHLEGVREMPWNKFVVQKARRYERDVVSLHIDGGVSWRFHIVSVLRRMLFLKAHPEAALLVDEAVRLRGRTLHVHVGETLSWTHFDERRSPSEWAAWLRKGCLDLLKRTLVPQPLNSFSATNSEANT